MTKLYRNISLAAFALTANMATAAEPLFINAYTPWTFEAPATVAPDVEEVLAEDVTIKAEGRKIHVYGADGENLEVFNITGVKIASYSIDAPEKTVTLSVPRGVYILRVGKVTRKVNIL